MNANTASAETKKDLPIHPAEHWARAYEIEKASNARLRIQLNFLEDLYNALIDKLLDRRKNE